MKDSKVGASQASARPQCLWEKGGWCPWIREEHVCGMYAGGFEGVWDSEAVIKTKFL